MATHGTTASPRKAALASKVRAPLPLAPPTGTNNGVATGFQSIRLPAEHFAAAIAFLLAGALGLVWIAPELAAGTYLSPHVAGVTHLFTLGWLTTTIFGVLYQVLPVALGAPIWSRRMGHVGFWCFAPGVALFAAGVFGGSTMLHHAGIALVGTGILLVAANISRSLIAAPTRDVTWAAVATAIVFLVSTLGLGIVLLHNVHTGFLAGARVRVLAAHLHIALVGWVLMMMVGVSHRMLPMFLLARDADTRWTRRSLILLATGVITLAAGLLVPEAGVAWLGALLLEGGVACFLWQVYSFFRVRVRRTLDAGMRYAAVGLVFVSTSALLGPAVLAGGASHPRLATAYVSAGLLGGFVLFVSGFFYKIVPMIAWTARSAGRTGTATVPSVGETYSARLAYVQLGLMTLGIALLGLGIGILSPHVARCGAILWATGVLLFTAQIVRVATGGRVAHIAGRA